MTREGFLRMTREGFLRMTREGSLRMTCAGYLLPFGTRGSDLPDAPLNNRELQRQ